MLQMIVEVVRHDHEGIHPTSVFSAQATQVPGNQVFVLIRLELMLPVFHIIAVMKYRSYKICCVGKYILFSLFAE